MINRKDHKSLSTIYEGVDLPIASPLSQMGGTPVMITFDMPGAEEDTQQMPSDIEKICDMVCKLKESENFCEDDFVEELTCIHDKLTHICNAVGCGDNFNDEDGIFTDLGYENI